jgi:hypothetical protein
VDKTIRGAALGFMKLLLRAPGTGQRHSRPRSNELVCGLSSVVVASGCVGHITPHPEIFRIAAKRLRCNPARVLYVGERVERDVPRVGFEIPGKS